MAAYDCQEGAMTRYDRLMARFAAGECILTDGATGTEAERRGIPQLEKCLEWRRGAEPSGCRPADPCRLSGGRGRGGDQQQFRDASSRTPGCRERITGSRSTTGAPSSWLWKHATCLHITMRLSAPGCHIGAGPAIRRRQHTFGMPRGNRPKSWGRLGPMSSCWR